MKKTVLLFYFLFFIFHFTFSQVNLVPNPSFEDTVSCPTTANQIDKAVGWHSSRVSPDYFNECDFVTGSTAVPSNFCGYQYAFDGVAYVGFVAYTNSAINGREYFTCQLYNSLIIGKNYKVSFNVSLSGGLVKTLACNKIGLLFSSINYDMANNAPTSNSCQFHTDSIIADTLNWTKITGSFIADSNYQYMSVGNFFDDINTDTLWTVFPSTYAYYYLDSISVIEDTTTGQNEIQNSVQLFGYPNPSSGKVVFENKTEFLSHIDLYDAVGTLISTFKNTNFSTYFEIDISDLSNGIYFAKINYHSESSIFYKLLKQ